MPKKSKLARPPEYGSATGSAFLSDRMVEDYIRTLPWTPLATEDEKALVAGNLRTFAGYVREHLGTCKCGKPMTLACSRWVRDALAHQKQHEKRRRPNHD